MSKSTQRNSLKKKLANSTRMYEVKAVLSLAAFAVSQCLYPITVYGETSELWRESANACGCGCQCSPFYAQIANRIKISARRLRNQILHTTTIAMRLASKWFISSIIFLKSRIKNAKNQNHFLQNINDFPSEKITLINAFSMCSFLF